MIEDTLRQAGQHRREMGERLLRAARQLSTWEWSAKIDAQSNGALQDYANNEPYSARHRLRDGRSLTLTVYPGDEITTNTFIYYEVKSGATTALYTARDRDYIIDLLAEEAP